MLFENDRVMIMTGKLTSFDGRIIAIHNYQNKKQSALVESADENNKVVYRRYNTENLIKW